MRFETGTVAQDAFPDLDPPVREFLISGYSPEGWNRAILGIGLFDDEARGGKA
jgi:hypothetical protein